MSNHFLSKYVCKIHVSFSHNTRRVFAVANLCQRSALGSRLCCSPAVLSLQPAPLAWRQVLQGELSSSCLWSSCCSVHLLFSPSLSKVQKYSFLRFPDASL